MTRLSKTYKEDGKVCASCKHYSFDFCRCEHPESDMYKVEPWGRCKEWEANRILEEKNTR